MAGLIPTTLAKATVLGVNGQNPVAKQSQPAKINLVRSCLPSTPLSLIPSKICSNDAAPDTRLDSHLWLQNMAKIFFSRSLLSSCLTKELKESKSVSTFADLKDNNSNNIKAVTQLTHSQAVVFPLSSSARNSGCLFAWQNWQTRRSAKAISFDTAQPNKPNTQNNTEPKSVDASSTLSDSPNASSPPARLLFNFPKLSRSSLIISSLEQNSHSQPARAKLLNPAPKAKRIASPFGWRQRPYSNQLQFHQGIDYGAPLGSPVVAAGNGIVTNVSSGCADFGNLFCGGQLGNWIEIDHGNGAIATYGHLKSNTILVAKGAKVWRNQEIAQVGSSGWSTGAHLDFRLKINGSYQDPTKYVIKTEQAKFKSAQNNQLNKSNKFIH